jgi:tRNA 2-selenouridine synthase
LIAHYSPILIRRYNALNPSANTTTPQPTQLNFENILAVELIKKQHKTTLLFEDEGSNIGALHIPDCIQAKTKQAELILLEF